jgi:hypothetical protein
LVSWLLLHLIFGLMLPGAGSAVPQADSSAVTRSPHGPLAIPCQNCHTFSGWKPIRNVPEFDHNKTRYPLRGMHQNVACTQCHTKPVFSNVGTKCADCHADIHRRQMGAACDQCHNVKGWRVALQSTQNNHQNRFPLTGAHAMLQCEDCHKGAATGQFQGLSTACYSCHSRDYQQTTGPNHAQVGFSTTCQQCHSADTWSGAAFDHLKLTGFALDGGHARLDCTACHAGGRYQGTPATCVGCHLKDFQATTNPNHVQAGISQTCQTCHTTASWTTAKFDHTLVGFPLTGAHATVGCLQCHVGGKYAGTPRNCAGCHMQNFQQATNPNHVQLQFPQTCEQCHTTTAWSPANFDHNTVGFPLTGMHAKATCNQCHANGRFAGTPTDCAACHLGDFQKTTNPNHVQSGFPQTCQTCHNTNAWSPATFDHNLSRFPLTGAHTTVPCAQCHANGRFTGTPTDCASCHMTNYQQTTNPNHVQAAFPTTCASCHNTTAWTGATFNHAATGFALTGAHATVQCSQCHVNGRFAGTPTDCASCHLPDYQGATNPNHAQSGFPTTCASCHNTTSWVGATFNHAATGFPLTGMHATIQCSQCHANGRFAGTPTDCASCHLTDYQKTTNPNHAQAGFPTDCSICHSTTNWLGAVFDHSKTLFPLTGFHATVSCAQCHSSGVYKGLSTACASCHLKDFNATTNPNHTQAGFPQQCEVCHNTTAWIPASFDHNKTNFPLTGAHTTVACANCHVGGKYLGTPTDCYSCHKAVYQSTTNPNHIAAGFPTTCQTCHNTTAWTGATFNHTWFPMNHGSARVCADCHTNPSNYTVFTCTNCHGKTQTDRNHSGVRNYVYNSANCYSCHPSGRGG